MKKGKIIFLNGVTSAGKTSIVDAMQNRGDIFFYALANDLFQDMVGERYLRENYWKYLGEVLMEMYRTAKEFSDRGHHVILDGVLSERPEIPDHYGRMLEILSDSPLYMVHVTCPLELCRKRNLARGDRGEFQSHEQAKHMPQNVEYALEVDTSVLSAGECAEIIIRHIFGQSFEPRDSQPM